MKLLLLKTEPIAPRHYHAPFVLPMRPQTASALPL